VFLADANFNIIFANDRAMDTIRKFESEFRKAFNVEIEDIVGATIHRFHKDKRMVEQILKNPSAMPHQAEFTFGNISLRANINSVLGRGSELLGYVVNWEDVTERIKLEAEYITQVEAIGKSHAVIPDGRHDLDRERQLPEDDGLQP
jgi:methyl-accepting chemotaxis protein